MDVVFRVEWSAAECERLYRHHNAEWKKAQADLDVLPWWRILRRSRAHARYAFHLNRAAIFDECRVIEQQ